MEVGVGVGVGVEVDVGAGVDVDFGVGVSVDLATAVRAKAVLFTVTVIGSVAEGTISVLPLCDATTSVNMNSRVKCSSLGKGLANEETSHGQAAMVRRTHSRRGIINTS